MRFAEICRPGVGVLAVVMMFAACSGSKGDASDSDTAVAVAPGQDELMVTPDLLMWQLAGDVASCAVESFPLDDDGRALASEMVSDSLVFAPDGLLTLHRSVSRYGGRDYVAQHLMLGYDSERSLSYAADEATGLDVSIERDPEGQIAVITETHPEAGLDSENAFVERYVWEDGLPVSYSYEGYEGSVSKRMSYDADGLLAGVVTDTGDGEGRLRSTETYEYTSFDESGNWTGREVSIDCVELVIDEASGRQQLNPAGQRRLTQRRRIHYR